MTHCYRLGDGPSDELGGWKGTYATADGLINLHFDSGAYDFYIDAKEGYRPRDMKALLEGARSHFGLEPLDEDEMEPELLEDGTIRIYLTPVPAADFKALRLVAA
ncbi:hypothetical protein [Streptomyces collinus]|uniref:hypothetical protein n=1 Tax=Streptomyces collinus TaxID=42684 RepID=UPI0037B1ED38